MTPNQVIVLATPVFLLLIAVEFWVGRRRGRNTYALADSLNSIGLGMLSRIADVFTLALRLGIYVWVQDHAALWQGDAFWTSPAGWLLALVFYDFLYYWNHRLGHEVGVLWAAHVVHHQSQHYNLSTALRQPASRWRWRVFRRWCSRWWGWWTCSTSSGSTPNRWDRSDASTAGSPRPRTTACITR